MKLLVGKKNSVLCLVICLFIFSECCPIFSTLDKMHVKHYVLLLTLIVFLLKNAKKLPYFFSCTQELKSIGLVFLGIAIISLVLQIINENFQIYTLIQLYYLIVPVVFISLFYTSGVPRNIDCIMRIILYSMLLVYFINAISIGTLSISNLINSLNVYSLFVNSESSVIEIGAVSSCCTMLEIYFLSKGNIKYALLSFVGVVLGYKRLCVLIALLLLVFSPFIKYAKVNKKIIYLSTFVFVMLPFVTQLLCTDAFANLFYSKFGISFDYFTKTRFSIINAVIDASIKPNGLGTVTNFLESRGVLGQTNMHNDLLMIYLDCTIIGSVLFTYNYFKLTEESIYSYLVILFMFSQMFVTHSIGKGTMMFWLIGYLLIFNFNREKMSER